MLLMWRASGEFIDFELHLLQLCLGQVLCLQHCLQVQQRFKPSLHDCVIGVALERSFGGCYQPGNVLEEGADAGWWGTCLGLVVARGRRVGRDSAGWIDWLLSLHVEGRKLGSRGAAIWWHLCVSG